MSKEKYVNGLDMEQFKRLPEISSYNRNYYVGFDGDLLLGISDDDITTEWYLILDHNVSYYLGDSYCYDEVLYVVNN